MAQISRKISAAPFSRNPSVLLGVFFLACAACCGCSRSHPQAAAAPQLPPIEFVSQWGESGSNPGQFDQPIGLAVDADDRVYVANRGTSFLEKFEIEGVPLLNFEDRAISGASGVAVDSGGGIYVADARAGQIFVFFPEGELLRVLRMAPQRGFEGLFGFSVGADGAVFVPDPVGSRVQVLDSHGRVEKLWKMPPDGTGKAARPVAAVAGPGDFVYVAYARSDRIAKFNRNGEMVGSWGDSEGDAATVLGLAVSQKHVFILRDASPYLEVWSLDGKSEASDDLAGHWSPPVPGSAAALACAVSGDLFVLGGSEARVTRFRIHLDSR